MKVAMFASESNPLCKSGGLADVVYSLSAELAKEGHEVIIAIPYYKSIANNPAYKFKKGPSFTVYMSWRQQSADVYTGVIDGITYYLIRNSYYFDRDKLYGYDDDGERFAFFALACRRLLKVRRLPGRHRSRPRLADRHRALPRQGAEPAKTPSTRANEVRPDDPQPRLQRHDRPLSSSMISSVLDDSLYDTGKVSFPGDGLHPQDAALVYSDKITTVSPSHREELLSSVGSSQGLDGVLNLSRNDDCPRYPQWHRLRGMESELTTPLIAMSYDATSIEEGKHRNQTDLAECLPCGLVWRSGLWHRQPPQLAKRHRSQFFRAAEKALEFQGATLVVLGNGEYEPRAKSLESLRKSSSLIPMGVYIGYNAALAHKIYGGCRLFPHAVALFGPCGFIPDDRAALWHFADRPLYGRARAIPSTAMTAIKPTMAPSRRDRLQGLRRAEAWITRWALRKRSRYANQNLYYTHRETGDGDSTAAGKSAAKEYVKMYKSLLK
jgi:starch synthase